MSIIHQTLPQARVRQEFEFHVSIEIFFHMLAHELFTVFPCVAESKIAIKLMSIELILKKLDGDLKMLVPAISECITVLESPNDNRLPPHVNEKIRADTISDLAILVGQLTEERRLTMVSPCSFRHLRLSILHIAANGFTLFLSKLNRALG